MQFSRNVLGLRARLALITAGAVAVGTLAACDGGGGGNGQLIRATIAVQSITQQGECEDTNIKVTPLEILPNPPKMANGKEFVTPVKLTKGADNVTCSGEANTIPMAPGKWKFTANLPSEIATCERDIAAGGNLKVSFKDGELTCS
jgi:hypothetical protein